MPGNIWEGFPKGVILEPNFEDVCDGLNCVPQNSYVKTLAPNVTAFGDRTFKDVIRLNEIMWVGHDPI